MRPGLKLTGEGRSHSLNLVITLDIKTARIKVATPKLSSPRYNTSDFLPLAR